MAKVAKTFRLAEQAIGHLEEIQERTGTSQTAIVEQALALYRAYVEGGPAVPVPSAPSAAEEESAEPRTDPAASSPPEEKLTRQQRRAMKRERAKRGLD